MNGVNTDSCSYEKIQLNILNAFTESNDYETSVTVNNLEKNVSVKFERKDSGEVFFAAFDLNEMGRGFVLIKVFWDPKGIEFFEPNFLMECVCDRNIDRVSNLYFCYGSDRGGYTLFAKIEKLESFFETKDIWKAVTDILDNIKKSRNMDVDVSEFSELNGGLDGMDFRDER